MKKALKLLACLCCTLLLLLAAAAVLIKIYLPPEKIRKLVLEYAASALNREIKIGSVSADLKGISLEDVAVSEYPDFSKGEFLKAGKFQASLRLKPLLQKKIEISSVKATGISLHLKRQRRDVYNFSDLISPAKQVSKGPEHQRSGLSISVSNLSVEDSQIIFIDSVLPAKLKILNMQMKAGDISAGKPFNLRFESAIDVKSAHFTSGARSIPVKAEFVIDPAGGDMEKASVKIRNLHVSWDKFSAEMSGSAVNLPAPEVSLRLDIKPFRSDALKKWFPSIPKNVPLPGISAESVFKTLKDSVDIKSLSARAGPVYATLEGKLQWAQGMDYMLKTRFEAIFPETDSRNIARHFPKMPKNLKIPAVMFSGRADLSPEKTRIPSFRMKLGGIIASGSGDIAFAKSGPAWQAGVSVETESVSLEEIAGIVPYLQAYGLGGTISARQRFQYSKKAGINYSGTIGLSKVKASYSGYRFTEITGPVVFSTSEVTAGPLSGKLDGAGLKASLSAGTKTPQIAFDVELERFNLAGLPVLAGTEAPGSGEKTSHGSPTPAWRLHGKAAIGELTHPNFSGKNMSFDCDLRDITPGMGNINGKASFAVRDGRLKDLSAIARNFAVGKVLLLPVILLQKVSRAGKVKLLPNFDDVPYSIMKGKYDFQKGNMKILESGMDSSMANVNMSGSVDLPTERLDIRIQTKLLEASGVKVARPIEVTVKGTLSDPLVRLDVKSIIKQPEVEKALEKGIEKGKKLLQNLFK